MMAEKPGAASGTTAASPQSTPLRKAPLFTAREVWWSMFAAISLAYLGVRAIAPDWLEDLTPANGAIAEQADIQAQRIAQRLSGEVRNLQSSVQQLQLDVAKVRTEVAGEAEQSRVLSSKVSALEQKTIAAIQTETTAATAAGPAPKSTTVVTLELPPTTAPAPAPAETAPAEPQAAVINSTDAALAIATAGPGAISPTPQPLAAAAPAQHKIINSAAAKPAAVPPPTKPIETGSVAAPQAIAFGPAVVKRAAKPIGLQISSSTSVESLRESWASLSQNHAAALQNMQPLYVAKGPAANQTFDLVAGPVKSKAEAIKLCKDLAAKNVACKVGAFEGSAF